MNATFKEVKLPSGAMLKIQLASFGESKALYKAVLRVGKGISFTSETDMSSLIKDIFCSSMSSPNIEKCLWVCFAKCIYNNGSGDLKIDEDTFEPARAREDYLTVCMEVAKENILPFVKSLSAEYSRILAMLKSDPA